MRLLTIITMSALLASCAMPTDDLINNRFPEIAPTPPSADIVGKWTGASGPYLITFEINPDGKGLYCYSWGEKNALNSAKHVNGRLHLQDGTSLALQRSGEKLIGESGYTGAKAIVFVTDGTLVEASPYCKNHMS